MVKTHQHRLYPRVKTNSVSAGDIEMIKLYMQLGDEISGVSSALRGEKAASGTPSSLYAQQVQNSANNLSGCFPQP